jgi:hypothetical protein
VYFNMILLLIILLMIMFLLKLKHIVMLKKLLKHYENLLKIVIQLKVEYQIGEQEIFNILVHVDLVLVQIKILLMFKMKINHHHQHQLFENQILVFQVHQIIYLMIFVNENVNNQNLLYIQMLNE